jgi:RNA polymerase sigma-70 factor (ECF subfamily)
MTSNEKLRAPSHFGAWISNMAVNLARTERRSTSPVVAWDGDERRAWNEMQTMHNIAISPEARLIQQEMVYRIRRAVADLPEAEREAVVLVYLEELSHQEAADQLDASLNAVKVRVHRGRNRLRQALMTEFGPSPDRKKKEIPMFKVVLHDVVTASQEKITPPQGELEEKKVFGKAGRLNVVLLREEDGVRALPIWIGPFEAESIAIHLRQGKEINRPLTFDLMKTLLGLGRVRVARGHPPPAREGLLRQSGR